MADPFDSLPDLAATVRGVQFAFLDLLRRTEGEMLGQLGLDPQECAYDVIASGPFWRLRDYLQTDSGPSVLIVPAPIKRPYIWDLAPEVSAIRACLKRGLRVFLLEWLPATDATASLGLKDYADDAISASLAKVEDETETKPCLMGHSLGGTLAAIHCALKSDDVRGLMLLGAPICFAPGSSHFRDSLVTVIPAGFDAAKVVPGSLLAQVSSMASPETFVWERLRDSALSLEDRATWDTSLRVERWALDEVALPGRLVDEMIELLYRENRFCRGALTIGDRPIGTANVQVPALAVINMADDIATSASVEPFMAAMQKPTEIIDYPGEIGVGLQHLAILIGREARARIWPEIFSWLSRLA